MPSKQKVVKKEQSSKTPSKIYVRVSKTMSYPFGSLNRSDRSENAFALARKDFAETIHNIQEEGSQRDPYDIANEFSYKILDPWSVINLRGVFRARPFRNWEVSIIAQGLAKAEFEKKYGIPDPEINPHLFSELPSSISLSQIMTSHELKGDEQLVFLKPEIQKFLEEQYRVYCTRLYDIIGNLNRLQQQGE